MKRPRAVRPPHNSSHPKRVINGGKVKLSRENGFPVRGMIKIEGEAAAALSEKDALNRFQESFARGDDPMSEFYMEILIGAGSGDKLWGAMEDGIKEWKNYIPTAKERQR